MLTIKKTTQLTEKELETIMAIWLQTNLEAHPFVAPTYWQENKAFVRAALPKATLTLAEEDDQIIGFLGLMDNYIAGIFIKKSVSREGHRSEITASSKRRTGPLIFGCLQGKSSSLCLLSKTRLCPTKANHR